MRLNSKALRQFRKEAGLNQRELAEKAGISLPMMTVLDSGKRETASEKIISALAIVLNVTMQDLLLVNEEDVSPFEFLDDRTRKHLHEQGYSPDTYDPDSAKEREEDDIDRANYLLSLTGCSIDRKQSNVDKGFVIIQNGAANYKVSVVAMNQLIQSLADYESYLLSRILQNEGKAPTPAFVLTSDEMC